VKLKDATFKAAPKVCEGCHEDPHGGQFAVQGKLLTCSECHNTARFKPSLFDHARRANYPLEGVHQNVRCTACHKNTKTIEDRTVLVYKPTPRKCIDCHGANVPGDAS
jgi:hypothetical protein